MRLPKYLLATFAMCIVALFATQTPAAASGGFFEYINNTPVVQEFELEWYCLADPTNPQVFIEPRAVPPGVTIEIEPPEDGILGVWINGIFYPADGNTYALPGGGTVTVTECTVTFN